MKKSHYQDDKKTEESDLKIKDDLEKKPFLAKTAIYFLSCVVLIAVIFATIINFKLAPASLDKDKSEYFEIKKGESTREISTRLRQQSLIKSDFAFYVYALVTRSKIQAGYYRLSSGVSSQEIITKFAKGEVDAYSVTIPEGYRALQIAKLFQEKISLDPNKFIAAAIGTEGTLFPDTYVFPSNTEPAKIVKTMQDNFDKKTNELKLTQDQLILASIVEREALSDDERPKIAAVYKNRADKNMLLQADPTVRYALDTQQYTKTKSVDFEFWQGLSRADIQDQSSVFNTYKNRGLPPAPICNPGLKSIGAAINVEANFDYLFFFHDKDKKIHFSKTYDEHLKAIQEFGVSS